MLRLLYCPFVISRPRRFHDDIADHGVACHGLPCSGQCPPNMLKVLSHAAPIMPRIFKLDSCHHQNRACVRPPCAVLDPPPPPPHPLHTFRDLQGICTMPSPMRVSRLNTRRVNPRWHGAHLKGDRQGPIDFTRAPLVVCFLPTPLRRPCKHGASPASASRMLMRLWGMQVRAPPASSTLLSKQIRHCWVIGPRA